MLRWYGIIKGCKPRFFHKDQGKCLFHQDPDERGIECEGERSTAKGNRGREWPTCWHHQKVNSVLDFKWGRTDISPLRIRTLQTIACLGNSSVGKEGKLTTPIGVPSDPSDKDSGEDNAARNSGDRLGGISSRLMVSGVPSF